MNDGAYGEAVREGALAPPGETSISLRINGATHDLQIEARVSLLDALREYLGIMGPKKGCNQDFVPVDCAF